MNKVLIADFLYRLEKNHKVSLLFSPIHKWVYPTLPFCEASCEPLIKKAMSKINPTQKGKHR